MSFTATNGAQEVGKATHLIGLTGCSGGSIVIVASVDPPVGSGDVFWTGGDPGANAFQRRVSCGGAGDTDLQMAILGVAAYTAKVHVVAASTPPAAGVNALLTHAFIGPATLNPDEFGRVDVTIGQQGIVAPTYNIDPYFQGDRWVFRLRDVYHGFKKAVQSRGRIPLPEGNPTPFPLVPGFSLQDSHTLARIDLDTSNLMPGEGARQINYWVEAAVELHENFHVYDFYSDSAYWPMHMGLFESSDVEGSGVGVTYDCNDATTVTNTAAAAKLTPMWDTAISSRHQAADVDNLIGSEVRAHNASNPVFVPIWSAIPNP